MPTIEEELMKALAKSHVIPPDFDYGRLHFQRCSRTDKGVSAARQIVSLKISPSRLTVRCINVYCTWHMNQDSYRPLTRTCLRISK